MLPGLEGVPRERASLKSSWERSPGSMGYLRAATLQQGTQLRSGTASDGRPGWGSVQGRGSSRTMQGRDTRRVLQASLCLDELEREWHCWQNRVGQDFWMIV